MAKLVLLLVMAITLATAIAGCATTPPPASAGNDQSIIPTIIFMVVIFGVFYFLMVRPQRKRQKQHQQMMQELQKGDQVITAGGIYGAIHSIEDESIVLKVESGTLIRVARSSVAGKRGLN